MRILIVEDEAKVADLLARSLREEGFAVDVAADGRQGEDMAAGQGYDVIVMDWMLPRKDGRAVCRSLRERGLWTPVLILTAKDAVPDRIDGLNAGADDYLAKPFVFEELLARLRALLRRHGDKSPILRVADLELDPIRREVRRSGQQIHLTPREYALLEYMLRQTGVVLDRTTLLEHIWDDFDSMDSNIVDVYINYLRQKIDKGFASKVIQTVRGAGYVLKAGHA